MKNNWQKIILSKVAVFESGKRMLGGRQKNGDVLSIGGEHISIDGSLDLSSKNYLSLDFYHKLKNGKIFDNDILMVKDGATTGKTIFLKKLPTKFLAVNEHVFIIRSKNEDLLNQYLYYCLISREGVAKIKLQKHGLIGGINKRNLDSIEILYPPKPTQLKIVKVLDSIRAEIGQQKEIIKKIKELKKSLMKKLFSQGTRGEKLKETKIGKVPVSWGVDRIENTEIKIIDGDRGFNYPQNNDFLKNGYCLFLNTKNVLEDKFNFSETQFITKEKDEKLRKGKLKRDDIVLTTRGTVGNIAYYSNNITYRVIRINSGMVVLRNEDNKIDTKFLFNYFRSQVFQLQSTGNSSGSAQPQLPIGVFKKFYILIPSINEQKEIALILEKVDAKIESAQRQKKLYEELFNNSLNKLMTQEIDIEKVNF